MIYYYIAIYRDITKGLMWAVRPQHYPRSERNTSGFGSDVEYTRAGISNGEERVLSIFRVAVRYPPQYIIRQRKRWRMVAWEKDCAKNYSHGYIHTLRVLIESIIRICQSSRLHLNRHLFNFLTHHPRAVDMGISEPNGANPDQQNMNITCPPYFVSPYASILTSQ